MGFGPKTGAQPRPARPTLIALDRTQGAVPFHTEGNIATAGGCLASQYLAAWTITRTIGEAAARDVIDYVAPVGENTDTVERAMRTISAGEPALR